MKINGDIKRDSIFAGLAGIMLTIVIVSAVFVVPPVIDFINNPFTPGPGPLTNDPKLGASIAKYMDDRSSDVFFAWSRNNTFVNYNITSYFSQVYEDFILIDGVLISGAPIYGSPVNVSVIHEPVAETVAITPSGLSLVVDAFANALSKLNTTSPTITEPYDIWPPIFLWDIAYIDGSSLSLIYSSHILAAVNGTWSYTDNYFHGVQFPEFDYTVDSQNAAYFVLDDETESLVLAAIQALYDLITRAYG